MSPSPSTTVRSRREEILDEATQLFAERGYEGTSMADLAERVTRNLAAVAGEDPDAWLVQLLEEYVGFALFQAGSLLPREGEAALAAYVAEALKPVRSLESTTPPSSLRSK